MMASGAVTKAQVADEIQLGNVEFEKIAVFAKRRFGLSLSESKRPLVQSRLSRRLRRLRVGSFADYFSMLEDPGNANESTELLSLLTTNVTQFFREAHHFDTLRNDVLPPLLDAARGGARVRIWSAGCSTGPEPYSIAMVIKALCPNAHKLNVKVLGTDIDPVVVRQAMVADYSAKELTQIPAAYKSAINSGSEGGPRISEEVKSLVSFGTLNLIEPFPFSGKFDAIFCRNVAIYFDKATQQDVWQSFANYMTPNGFLFLGHSERLSGPAQKQFKNVGITTYRRNG